MAINANRKGWRAEHAVQMWLIARHWINTKRNGKGQAGGDMLEVPGWHIEVKDHQNIAEALRLGTKQAQDDCQKPWWVAIIKRKGKANVADWYAVMTVAQWACIVEQLEALETPSWPESRTTPPYAAPKDQLQDSSPSAPT